MQDSITNSPVFVWQQVLQAPAATKTAIADDAKIQAAVRKPAMNYLMTSTAYKPIYNSTSGLLTNIQFFGLMSTINATKYPEGRLSLSYVSIKAGMQVVA